MTRRKKNPKKDKDEAMFLCFEISQKARLFSKFVLKVEKKNEKQSQSPNC